jgi:hypothetical protein
MTEQIAAGCSIIRTSLGGLRGERVKVRAMNRGGSTATRTGTLQCVGFRNVVIVADSGWAYHIPLLSIVTVEAVA